MKYTLADPILPVALAAPLVIAVVALLMVKPVNVPTDVILPCAAVVTVPATTAVVAFGTVPVTLAPGRLERPDPDPACVPAVIVPAKLIVLVEINTPDATKLAPVMLPAALMVLVDSNKPVNTTLAPVTLPVTDTLAPVIAPVTAKLVSVPTLVMLGCAAELTVAA